MPDGAVVPDDLVSEGPRESNDSLSERQKRFVFSEFTDTLTKALMESGTNEWQKHFLYCKVLMAWFIVIDPRGALETFRKSMELCQSFQEEGVPSRVEILVTLFSTTLYSFLADADVQATIDIIDQQKPSGTRSVYTGADSITRYLAHLSGASPGLVQYIVEQRLP